MTVSLTWKNIGLAAPSTLTPPGVPSLISTYVLDVEPGGQVLYFFEPDDDARGTELWAFGTEWKLLTKKRTERLEHLEGGGWDEGRQALVAFGFRFEYQSRQWVPDAVAVGLDGKGRKLTFTGELPVTETEALQVHTFDARGAFCFDRARKVWVCFTRLGVWELGADDAWTKKGASTPETIGRDWSHSTGLACFDPVKQQPFFWCQVDGEKGYPIIGFHWDGATLQPASMDGLPELSHGLFNPSLQLGAHAKHGLVLQVDGQLFAPSKSGWSALPTSPGGPPRMEGGQLVHEPKRDAIFVGPAKHHRKGSDFQRMFFVFERGGWSVHGAQVSPSELGGTTSPGTQAHFEGTWLATPTNTLRTWVRTDDAWKERVDEKAGEAILGRAPLGLVAGPRLVAVNWKGAVAEFTGGKWKVVLKSSPVFKERREWCGAWDGAGRLVVWGGDVKNRKSNDTLFFENGKWRVVKKPSPQPADFKHGKDGVYVDFHLAWDSALGRVLRFGFEDVAMLGDDETWATLKVKDYKKSISSRGEGHLPLHDEKTGQTLLVDFENARLTRFDLKGCTPVGTFEWPDEVKPKKQHDRPASAAFSNTWSWNAATRTLHALHLGDARHVFALELGPAFDAAAKQGARTTLGPQAVKAAAAEKTVLYRVKNGTAETTVASSAKALEEKKKAGFVTAAQLDDAAFEALVGVPSEVLVVGNEQKGKGALPLSRLGGPAPAVAAKKWPKVGKRPMGFLLQLETGALLKKHAGVAVFCATDGEAPNEEGENAVVLLSAADLKKTGAAPAGVAELPVQPITFKPPKLEIDEKRALTLGEKDASFVQALEKFQRSNRVQPEGTSEKRGGLPVWLQGGDGAPKGWKLVAQVDFDHEDVSDTWPDAGLMGCLYVFVKDDERDAFATWQYT